MRALFISFMILFIYGTIHGQSSHQQVVQTQLDLIEVLLKDKGYEKTHNYAYSSLNDDGTETYNFNLKKGWQYAIVAVCDNDCKDLDVCIYDENGNKIECDQSNDSTPIVEAAPIWTGEFKIKVTMYDCRSNPCYYGIGIFGKQR